MNLKRFYYCILRVIGGCQRVSTKIKYQIGSVGRKILQREKLSKEKLKWCKIYILLLEHINYFFVT